MKRWALRTIVAVVVAAGAAACSGSVKSKRAASCDAGDCAAPDSGTAPAEEAVVPGPRDGARLTRDGVDRLRGVRCQAHPTEDGMVRCLPDTPYSTLAESLFANAECTEALAIVPGPQTCDLASRLFVTSIPSSGSCPSSGSTAQAFRIERDSTFNTAYRLSPGGGCEPVGSLVDDVLFYRAVITPTDPKDWVDLVRDETTVTSRLAISYWEGSDGSRFFDSYRLLPEDEPCEPFPPPESGRKSYCVPKGALPPSFPYADYSCTPLPDTLPTCDGGTTELRGYPELEVTLSGTGRLRVSYLTAEGQKLRAIGHHDVTLNGPCHREVLEDGVAYCVGAGTFSDLQGGLFTDPTCTRFVATVHRSCREQRASAVMIGPGAACGDIPHFQDHTEHQGPIYGFTFAAPLGCAEYPREEGVDYFVPGAPLPPADLYASFPQDG